MSDNAEIPVGIVLFKSGKEKLSKILPTTEDLDTMINVAVNLHNLDVVVIPIEKGDGLKDVHYIPVASIQAIVIENMPQDHDEQSAAS